MDQPSYSLPVSITENLAADKNPGTPAELARRRASHRRAAARPIGTPLLRRRSTLIFSAVSVCALALVLAAYSNSIHNSFHFDDSHVIEDNVFIRDLRNVPRFFLDARTFSSVPANATYRPVVSTTLALDYWLGHGLDPRPFHVTQLLLLVVTGAMLVTMWCRVLSSVGPSPWHRWTALLAATLFCVHTGNTQPVNYISARSELLSGIGVLGALLLYAYLPRARRFQLHLLPMAFGALAKTPAVMAAPLLLAYDLLIEKQLSLPQLFTRRAWSRTRAALVATAPAFVAAIALYVFAEGMNPPGQTYGGGGRLHYLVTESWVWIHYARLFVLPTGLSADTDLELFDRLWNARVAAGVVFAAALFTVMALASKRRDARVAAFGIAWFAIALAPSSSIFPLAEVANDHRIFFPFAGLSLAVVSWVSRRVEIGATGNRRPRALIAAAVVVAVAVLVAHAVGTYRRNRVWRNEETLWSDVVRKSPGNGRALMNYGLTQMEAGRYARARELFVAARRLLPNYSTLEVNLAIVENGLGNAAAADSHFVRALALNPAHPAPHRYYARWLMQRGRAPEAIPHLEYTVRTSPADIDARHLLMSLYASRAAPELVPLAVETLGFASGDTIAASYARGVPPFRPDASGGAAWRRLGLALTRDLRYADAAQAYRAALAIDSTNADAWNNLGWSLAKLGFYGDALPPLRSALRHDPGFTLAANNLAWAAGEVADARFMQAFALQQTGRPAESAAIYRDLLAIYPNWANVHYNLAHALMALGRTLEASSEFRRTLELRPAMTEAHLQLASCLKTLGRGAEAQRELDGYAVAPSERSGEQPVLQR